MMRFLALGLLFASVSLVRADQAPPEALLSSGTQVYFRWDGAEAHRAAREKSAVGKMLREDAGTFLVGLFPQLIQSVATNQTTQLLKKGVESSILERTQGDAIQAPKLVELVSRHGLILAAEARLGLPPDVQAILIVPDAGSDPSALFSTIRLLALLNDLPVQEGKFAGRSVQYLNLSNPPATSPETKPTTQKKTPAVESLISFHLAWWVEGNHAVVAFGTRSPEGLVQRLQEKGTRLKEKPLFQRVQAFKEFETGIRGFVDVASIVKIASVLGPGVAPILDAWGLTGFKSVVLQMGFDGEFTRTLAELTS